MRIRRPAWPGGLAVASTNRARIVMIMWFLKKGQYTELLTQLAGPVSLSASHSPCTLDVIMANREIRMTVWKVHSLTILYRVRQFYPKPNHSYHTMQRYRERISTTRRPGKVSV